MYRSNHYRRQNESASFTATTVAPTGTTAAVGSGAVLGLSQASQAVMNACAVLGRNTSQRDSVVRFLDALFKDEGFAIENCGLDTFPDDLVGSLVDIRRAIALAIKNTALSAVSAATQVPQITADSAVATTQVTKTSNNQANIDERISAASKEASTLGQQNHPSASAISVAKECSNNANIVTHDIDNAIKIDGNSHAESHATLAIGTAGTTLLPSGSVPLSTATTIDTIGQVSKEVQATQLFSAEESKSMGDKNVYAATNAVAEASPASDLFNTRAKLQALQDALSDMQPASDLVQQNSVVSPLTTALIRLFALSCFVGSSRTMNEASIQSQRMVEALRQVTDLGPSGGVDRINSLHANLCSLSNIMRLSAANFAGSEPLNPSAQSSEITLSRASSVALSHISKLTLAICELTKLPDADGESISDKTVHLAEPRVFDALEGKIRELLDKIEQENQRPIINGLNADMASQVASASKSSIVSSVFTHGIFTNPCNIAAQGTSAAVQTQDAQKNEALLPTSQILTQSLNLIQAFTRNFMDDMSQEKDKTPVAEMNSLLATHASSGKSTATVYLAVSALSLLCDEALSISRSLSLIDAEKSKAVSEKVSDLPTKDEWEQAKEQMAFDSHAGQNDASTAQTTALRLTFTHVGISIIRLAIALHKALDNNLDTVKDNLLMHTLQQQTLQSCATSTRYLAEASLFATGGISVLPLGLMGTANASQAHVFSTWQDLHPAPQHSCENYTNRDADLRSTSQSSGFSSDLISGTVTNLLKILSQTSLIGLNTSLEILKFLEIISLHRDCLVDLGIETKAASLPQNATHHLSSNPATAGSVGVSALLIKLIAALSADSSSSECIENVLQRMIDKEIEAIGTLEDDEEGEYAVGLKAFYKTMIRLLQPQADEIALDEFIDKLNWGGIHISSFHSKFAPYQGNNSFNREPMYHQPTIALHRQFPMVSDAQSLLYHFSNAAKRNPQLLKQLQDMLHIHDTNVRVSRKVRALYDFVFDDVYQDFKNKDALQGLKLHGRRRLPTVGIFQNTLDNKQCDEPGAVAMGVVLPGNTSHDV